MLSLGLSFLMTGSVFALGLGNISGQAILGQPLSIEISLLGSGNETLSVECFKVRRPIAEIDSAFMLRNPQIQLLGGPGRARLIITSSSPLREPVIEFGIAVGCGFELSRDYLLLASEPAKTTAPPLAIMPPILAPEESKANAQPPTLSKSGLPVGSEDQFLRLEKDVTLKALAQQNYPLQPKAREKYMRMMEQANPNLKQGADLISAGSKLRIPQGLPLRRQGAYHPEVKVASTAHRTFKPQGGSSQLFTAKKLAPKKFKRDLLVLGAPGQPSATELLAEAERLTALLMEQTNDQAAASEKITQLEDTLNALKKHVNGLESRLNTIEMERQAEKLATKPASLDFIELLLAVLAGGAVGGLTLHGYKRIQVRRAPTTSLVTPMPNRPNEDLPRKKSAASTGQTGHGATTRSPVKARQIEHPNGDIAEPENESPSSPQNDFDFVSKQSS